MELFFIEAFEGTRSLGSLNPDPYLNPLALSPDPTSNPRPPKPPTLPGVMELFFNEVSEGTRALGSSINLLTTAIGTYLAGALNSGIAAATKADPWVADNPLYGSYDL